MTANLHSRCNRYRGYERLWKSAEWLQRSVSASPPGGWPKQASVQETAPNCTACNVASGADASPQAAKSTSESSQSFCTSNYSKPWPGLRLDGLCCRGTVKLCPFAPSQRVQLLSCSTACVLRMKGEGDIVIAEACPDLPDGEVIIRSITGDDGRLPLVAATNCVGIAAIETIKLLGHVDCGVALTLQKVPPQPSAVCTLRAANHGSNSGTKATAVHLLNTCLNKQQDRPL